MTGLSRRQVAIALGSVTLATESHADVFDTNTVVSAAANEVRANFVDIEMGSRLADMLMHRLATGAYRTSSGDTLAQRMTADLRATANDQHLSVRYEPPGQRESTSDWAEDDLEFPDFAWGVQTTARLQGNIGLLRITHFPGGRLPQAIEYYSAAMTLLKDTRALIIDFTNNHGGGSDAHGYFMSYFVDGEVVLERVLRRNSAPEIISTSREIQGPRYARDKPIYIATSRITFSAGEGITEQLKRLRRAVQVGERTRGGANAGNFVNLPDHFRVFIVMGRFGGPGRNWESVGLEPDVKTRAADAVATAHRLALAGLIERETDSVRREVLGNVAAGDVENLSSFPFSHVRSR